MSNTRRPTQPPTETIAELYGPECTTAAINAALDRAVFGSLITITRTNSATFTDTRGTHGAPGQHSATVTGPALVGSNEMAKVVGIDLLDGVPHMIRDELGQHAGTIVRLTITTNRVAKPKATK